ncbi:MAG: hypothetical protein ACM3X6_08990 [Patescibacteria group bacterium]
MKGNLNVLAHLALAGALLFPAGWMAVRGLLAHWPLPLLYGLPGFALGFAGVLGRFPLWFPPRRQERIGS